MNAVLNRVSSKLMHKLHELHILQGVLYKREKKVVDRDINTHI